MLFTGWEVRMEKNFAEVWQIARGRRPRDIFKTESEAKVFFIPDQGQGITFFFLQIQIKSEIFAF